MDDRKAALLVSVLASFLTPFMASAVNIALPAIGNEFTMDAISLSWVTSVFLLTGVVFLVPFGRLADIYGRKRIFVWGMVLHALSSALAAASASGSMLIESRALQGAGGSMIFGTSVAILTSVYPATSRGRVLGYNVASVYLGLSLGPVLGGSLTQNFGWRSIFVLSLLLGTVIIFVIVTGLRGEWAEAKGEPFDFVGAILFSVSLAALMYGFSQLPGVAGILSCLAGSAVLLGFLTWESGRESPILNVKLLLGNTVFAFSNAAALINYSATYAVTFLLSLYLQYLKGLTAQSAGLILIFQPAVMALTSPFAGRLSDRVDPRVVASVGMGVIVAGLILFVFIDAGTPLWLISAGLVMLGLGFGLFSSPNTNAVMSSVERRFYGVASATLGTMRMTGQMLSMGIAMMLFAMYIGKVAITPEYYAGFLKSMTTAFAIFSVLCVGGIFASLARGKRR